MSCSLGFVYMHIDFCKILNIIQYFTNTCLTFPCCFKLFHSLFVFIFLILESKKLIFYLLLLNFAFYLVILLVELLPYFRALGLKCFVYCIVK